MTRKADSGSAAYSLALAAADSGQHDAAAALILRAIQLDGPVPQYCSDLGAILDAQGKTTQAVACYRQALAFDASGALTHARLGRSLLRLGELENARECFETSLSLAPAIPDTCFDLANVLHALRRYDQAALYYQRTLELAPDHAPAWYNLGVTRTVEQRFEEAIFCYRRALDFDPHYADAHNNLGALLQALGRVPEAIEQYHKAGSVESLYNLGLWLQQQDRLEEAERMYRSVIERDPSHAEAHNNLGNVRFALGQPADALAAYGRAIELTPQHAEAQWNLGLVHLSLGQFDEGWRGYEWRFLQPGSSPREFSQPLWDGSPLAGRRILLHAEQGLGDALQFVRYAPLVQARGGYVIVECHEPLLALFKGARGIHRLVGRGCPLPEFDCHAPLLSLPHIFGTRLDSIPAATPYLDVDPARVRQWGGMMDQWSRPRVGLTWSGNPQYKENAKRLIPPGELAGLAVPGIHFFSLQKGPSELLCLPPALGVQWLEDESTDLADTAAILQHLDLLITVDTSLAHLAGALGCPVWTLLAFSADWRWLRNRDDSPWYPTMRLFRQQHRGDWGPVLADVRRQLELLTNRQSSAAIDAIVR